jgi:hypothetical protein
MAIAMPFGKYSTVLGYNPELPGWVPEAHKERIASYQLYQEIYWSHVGTTYKLMNRGLDESDDPLYVPSSRIMIETINRYVAPKLWFRVEPVLVPGQEAPDTSGSDPAILAATQAFTDLFARERFASRYAANKREGLIKADWLWHIVADPDKEQGKRISLLTVKPENYFPVFEDETVLGGDPDKMVMVVLAELIQVGDEQQVRTQRYIKQENGTIVSTTDTWKTDEWFRWRHDDDAKQPIEVVSPPALLPAGITAFPVYHIPNTSEVGEVFGSSEMRGLEVLQAALNQSMTDEDLALALMGLGLYATEDKGSPTDSAGNSIPWYIAPGAVLENAKGLRKVEGLTTMAPYTDHVNRLEGYLGDATGATDAARGRMEVAEAESGVALQLRLAPTLSRAEEKDNIVLDVHRQMFYDLATMWFAAFEEMNLASVSVLPVLGDKLPVNRVAEAELVGGLVLGGILSAASARKYLASKGFNGMFEEDEEAIVLAEKKANAAAEGGTDDLGDRAAQEPGALDA